MQFFSHCLAEGRSDVLANFNFPRVDDDPAVLADVQPCIDFLGQRIAPRVPGSARLLCNRAVQGRVHQNTGAQKLEELAPIHIEVV